ncbi:FISUMP domain-containing protein [Dysgonomonas sp. 25]|uniref:FISUMP domain-containing protein n=1 Tax=Dysgonomonas sp. 25 TaxID=2302933 RepID=UPI0013D26144|nr:FISUMP domain-containing protein [Dysgonomonas sp. 25]NDV67627.1 hypothetical protein [Dysgonomonas sp. 25]
MRKTLTQAIIIIALFTTIGLQAQVTIGSSTPPRTGVLLDLTEGATTTRGLSMPRVALTKLKPANGTELSASIGGSGNWTLTDHTALAVYNTKADYCAVDPIYEGLYVFDGTEWQYLGQRGTATGIYVVIDARDNETYLARSFDAAGDWMLESMRYKDASINPGAGNNSSTDRFYIYPNGNPGTPSTAPITWKKTQGLLYTYAAATLGEQDAVIVNQSQISGSVPGTDEVENSGPSGAAPHKYLQGICPSGWHLPSDREWNELEKEIYEHADKYSQYAPGYLSGWSGGAWSSSWETTGGNRGSSPEGHGIAMKSGCGLPGQSNPSGKSLPAEQGGFDALLTGYASDGLMHDYGDNGYFLSASSFTNTRMMSRYVSHNNSLVFRMFSYRNYLYSVRCKKNE